MTDSTSAATTQSAARKWQPLNRFQRRVLGTLAEKAKTTPDGYPMTVAAIVTGANQKSNRSPQMNMTADQVETALDQLRALGATTEVYGTGRVSKFRHHLYEWLDVRGAEAAVMIELMLRGEQTIGELRGRAARFDESITDIAALRPLLESLIQKELVLALTPDGRGQMVTHNLYQPQELQSVRAAVAAMPVESTSDEARSSTAASPTAHPASDLQELRQQIERLTARVAHLEQLLDVEPEVS